MADKKRKNRESKNPHGKESSEAAGMNGRIGSDEEEEIYGNDYTPSPVSVAMGAASTNVMEEVDFTDNELVYYVRNALQSIKTDDRKRYDELIGVMHHKANLSADEVATLVTCLKALSGAVSSIDLAHHGGLLSTVFSMSLWNYVPEVMDALTELIVSLASHAKYVDLCLDMLVRNFIPPSSLRRWMKQPRGLSIKGQVLSRVHSALESISALIPLAPMRLSPLVVQRMPRLNGEEQDVMIYVENMFKLESGPIGPLVGSTMLLAVVDRLLDLDLDISWEEDNAKKGIFESELEDLDEIEDEIQDDGAGLPEAFANLKGLSGIEVDKRIKVAGKLDNLLSLTFEHLEFCKTQGRLNEVFDILLQSFRTTVLTAYKSKFAQFVMFYACSLDPESCGSKFARMLADIFMSHDYPPLTRMSAVAYLASYMARAKFVTTDFIMAILRRLVRWCSDYCNAQIGEVNPEFHRVFYSGCQAIMYVLCFRMRSLVNVPWLKSQLSQMPLESVLKHRLNPLVVCLPTVVEEFLRQSKAAHLFTVSKKFIFNDELESELSKAYGGVERLDSFFPFDPCLLKKIDRYIRPNYIFWSMVQSYDDDDEEGSSEEEEDEDEEGTPERNTGDDEMASSVGDREEFDVDAFDLSLNRMSITPKTYNWGDDPQPLARMPSRLRPSTSPESL